MNRGKWGNAMGPPQLRRALIGATLLLKGDLHAPWEAEPHEGGAPEAARANRGGEDLPGTKFGRSIRLALPRASSAPLPEVRPPRPAGAAARVSAASVKSGKAASLGALAAALAAAEPRRLNPAPLPRRLARAPHPVRAPLPQPANEPGSQDIPSAPKPLPQPAFGAGAQGPGPLPPPIDTGSAALAVTGPAPADTAVGNGEEPALPVIAAPDSPPPPPPEPPAPDEPAPQPDADEAAQPAVPDLAPAPEATVETTAEAAPEAAPAPAATPSPVSAPEPTSAALGGEPAAADLPQPAFGSSVITPLPMRAGARLAAAVPLAAPGGNTAAEPGVSAGAAGSGPRPQELSPATVAPDQIEAPAASDPVNAAELPQPAFGQTAPPPDPPARITLAYAGPEVAPPLPRPQFGAPALAAPATSSAIPPPLTGSGPATRPQTSTPQARTAYADTSPRIGGEAAPSFTYDDELILQLQSERGEIADTIVAYGTRSGVYLPFGAVARFLDLAISVSDEGHYASGWFIDESQTVSLNLRSGMVTTGGRELPLARGDAAAFEGELYLRAERFADLLPLTLTVDLRAQTVSV